jgi:hypothetical protein
VRRFLPASSFLTFENVFFRQVRFFLVLEKDRWQAQIPGFVAAKSQQYICSDSMPHHCPGLANPADPARYQDFAISKVRMA